MFNPIEARKRLVQERIEKSFQNNIGEQRERESTSDVVEKAYQVGDEKQFNGRNYYVHALNSKGQPMWRLKRDGAKKDDNKQKSSNNSNAEKTFTDIDGVRQLGGGDLREMGAYSGYQYGDDETITAARYVDDKGNDYWIVSQDVEGGGEEKFDEESDALQRFNELINISKKVDEKAKEASDNALKRAVADEKAKPEVREAAKKELDKRNGSNSNDNSGGDKKTDKKKPAIDVEKNVTKLFKKIDSLSKKKEGMWLKVRNLSNLFDEKDFGSKYLYGAKMYKPKGLTVSDDYYDPIGYQKKLKNGNTLSIFRAQHGEFFIKESGVDKYVDRLIIRDKDAVKDLKDLIKKFNETE